ncbi:MAG TPA: RNA methyltransferase [Anaerolineales bacterium]|nr:RNA methyltransferase [Anaerolineales bacterium]
MTPDTFQIRTCLSCGLRYPMTNESTFGMRCPVCLGETELSVRVNTDLKTNLTSIRSTESRRRVSVLLDNIRSAWNVGSIFRSADGFGFAHVYLCGITPTPENEAVTKTSLGAENYVSWSYHKDAVQLVGALKKEGGKVWALEEHERAVHLSKHVDADSTNPVILIVGNEVTGVDPGLIELSERIFFIPMRGEKTSFNVAIAFGIASYQLTGLS